MTPFMDKFTKLMLDFLPDEYRDKAEFIGQKMFVRVNRKAHVTFSLCWSGGVGVSDAENTLKIATNAPGVEPAYLRFADYFAPQLWRPSRNDEAYCPMFLVDTKQMCWLRVKPTETDLKLIRQTISAYLDIVDGALN